MKKVTHFIVAVNFESGNTTFKKGELFYITSSASNAMGVVSLVRIHDSEFVDIFSEVLKNCLKHRLCIATDYTKV